MTYMLLLNCALKLVEEIILYYDARSKEHQTFRSPVICSDPSPEQSHYIFNPYPANVENKVSYYNASRWQMGFNLAFKGLISSPKLTLHTEKM